MRSYLFLLTGIMTSQMAFATASEVIVADDQTTAVNCLNVAKSKISQQLAQETEQDNIYYAIESVRLQQIYDMPSSDQATKKTQNYETTFFVFSKMEDWGYTYNSIYKVDLTASSATKCKITKVTHSATWECGGPNTVKCW